MSSSVRSDTVSDRGWIFSSSRIRGGWIADTLFTVAVCSSSAIVLAVFLWLVGDVLIRGISGLSWQFLISPVTDSGRSGGIAPVLMSTTWIVGLALIFAFPLALATSVLIAEYLQRNGILSRFVVASLDVLAGMPSIVFGLFGNSFFNQTMGLGYSLISGGLTLACMILPFMIKANVDGFRSIPQSYREAANALALSRASTLWHVLLPTAQPAIVAGVLLGMARALAETAALLFTSGYVSRMPESLMDSGRTISVHIYDLAMNVAGGDQMAYASAVVLVALLILINSTVVRLGGWLRHRSLSA